MDEISREQVISAYSRAPQPVRDAFNSEAATELVLQFRDRYQLHIDVAGVIGEEFGYLLLGLRSPKEFYEALQQNGIRELVAREIVEQINQKIFIPLRERMEHGETQEDKRGAEAPRPSVAPAVPRSRTQTPVRSTVSLAQESLLGSVSVPSYGTGPILAPQTATQAMPPQGSAPPQSAPVAAAQVALQYAPPQPASISYMAPVPVTPQPQSAPVLAYARTAPSPEPSAPLVPPQPAPTYAVGPAPLPPRSVMPGAAPTQAYAPQQPVQLEQLQLRRPQAVPVPVPSELGVPAQDSYRAPETALPYSAPQLERIRQAEPPAPPPNLPGMYGALPPFAQPYPTPAPASYAPVPEEQQYQVPASQQLGVPAAWPSVPQAAPMSEGAPLLRVPSAGAPATHAQEATPAYAAPQRAMPAPAADNTDPYREPIG